MKRKGPPSVVCDSCGRAYTDLSSNERCICGGLKISVSADIWEECDVCDDYGKLNGAKCPTCEGNAWTELPPEKRRR